MLVNHLFEEGQHDTATGSGENAKSLITASEYHRSGFFTGRSNKIRSKGFFDRFARVVEQKLAWHNNGKGTRILGWFVKLMLKIVVSSN